jgi:SAM-dependent methyltransferase
VDVEWRVGDLSRLADPVAVYDAIFARVVLHLQADVPAVLREFRRVLRPGGRLYASVPGALSPIYNRSWRRFVEPESAGNTFMVPWELEQVLTALGWTVLDGWGEFGKKLTGDANPLDAEAVAHLDRRLRQAAATTWAVIAT